jgi:hypothetical protein
VPEPILISIAAALAGKAATGLFELVKRKFSGDPRAMAELEAAVEAPARPEAIEAVAERLAVAEQQDPDFRSALRDEWERVRVDQHAEHGGVANQISGDVGKAVQARDIHGDIRF